MFNKSTRFPNSYNKIKNIKVEFELGMDIKYLISSIFICLITFGLGNMKRPKSTEHTYCEFLSSY